MAKSLTIRTVEIDKSGIVFIELNKHSSDGDLLGCHRVSITPGSDIAAQIAAVDSSLATEGFAPISTADIARVTAIATATWTPENVTAWSAEFLALQEAERAKQVAAVQAVADATPTPAPVGVASVTMRQARLALLGAGLLDQVTAAIAALPEPDRTAAMIEWEYAATVERNSGLIPTMGAALGMTDAQLDALFVTAAGL